MFPGYGVVHGLAWDLTTTDGQGRAWDFDDSERRAAAWRLIKRDKPFILIGTPRCTAFSRWKNLSKASPEAREKELKKAVRHLKCCCG